MKIIKITLIILLIAIVSMSIYVYTNRTFIFYKTVNSFIKNLMPGYIKLKDVNFDFKNQQISVKNFRVLNPRGYNRPYLFDAPLIKCSYSQKDEKTLLGGLKVYNVELIEPVFYMERTKDSKLNIQEMDKLFKSASVVKKPTPVSKFLGLFSFILSPVKKIDKLLEIEPVVTIRNGSFIFEDRYIYDKEYTTSIEHIYSTVELDMREDFKGVDYIRAKGEGSINGRKDELLNWVSEYNLTHPKLTMANAFNMKGVDLTHFRPYYEKFSPFIFKRGRASGELIVNFDNGDIGSINEIRFSDIEIELKKDFAYAEQWIVNISDLYKYFTSASGEIIFDFKIKGPMDSPRFYLGPKAKEALAKMVVNKITEAIFKDNTESPQAEKSDLEKVIDIFKDLKNK